MKINSNIQAMITNNILKRNEDALSASSERASSGYKINSAKDNPAGMAITNKMNAQIRSLDKATQNSKNAINVISTAEGALSEIQAMVQRLNELAIKSSNGTNTTADRAAIQKEVDALKEGITSIVSESEYNTQGLLSGEQALRGYTSNENVKVGMYDTNFPEGKYEGISIDASMNITGFDDCTSKVDGNVITITNKEGGELKLEVDKDKLPISDFSIDLKGTGGMNIQTGSAEGQEVQIVIPKVSLATMGIENLRMDTIENSQRAMEKMPDVLKYISSIRSQLGAYQNRLESTVSNLEVSTENLTEAYSTIKDVDMAEEMVEYTRLQVLVQAGTSMLTQANEEPQQALQLLQ